MRAKAKKKKAYSNEYVTEIISRGIWMNENLSESVIECWRMTEEINAKWSGSKSNIPQSLKDARNAIIQNFDWLDSFGNPIMKLPFNIKQRTHRQYYEFSNRWPPTYATLLLVVGIIQALNFNKIAFCTGGRHSENAGADATSEHALANNQLVSQTYKHVDVIGGASRDWPLHPMAVRALLLQDSLADVIRPDGTKHIWVQFSDYKDSKRGYPLANMSMVLSEAVKNLDLADKSEGWAQAQRWRHTMAHLIALTVVDAVQVLYDLFGHADVEATMHYMLSDGVLASEAMRVSMEASIAMAEDAISEVLDHKAGGPAKPNLLSGLNGMAMRLGIDTFGTDDITRAAKILTANGIAWIRVRPGVLCTKAPGQFGPCTQARGEADPGNCRTTCLHRLELDLGKSQCRQQLQMLREDHDHAIEDGRVMQAVNFAGQILANLHRWDDVRDEFLQEFPHMRGIWSTSNA
ncbi:hypothetical protein [Phyllobacterium sp. LjRoot231]|uniref:hypothetical protein n=1 Tax=Phyllobacterium sp. LjRoot231 TaxID=3342289 RepID=UPI003F504D49